jgi:hypothetical protein
VFAIIEFRASGEFFIGTPIDYKEFTDMMWYPRQPYEFFIYVAG